MSRLDLLYFWEQLPYEAIPVNSTDLSSTLLISDPKNAVYWLITGFEEIYWLATDFAYFEKSSIVFSVSRSVCSLLSMVSHLTHLLSVEIDSDFLSVGINS